MRDPARIEEILERIRVAWHKSPDFRLGQFLVCATDPRTEVPEIFGMEDDILIERIERFFESVENATVHDPNERST